MLSMHEHNVVQSYDLAKIHHELKIKEMLAHRRQQQLADEIRQGRKAPQILVRIQRWLHRILPQHAQPNVVMPIQREVK